MKKIGFIDYYIDEWHAHNFPEMIRKSSFAGKYDVALAWEQTPMPGKMSLDDFCRKQNIGKAQSLGRPRDLPVVLLESREDDLTLGLRLQRLERSWSGSIVCAVVAIVASNLRWYVGGADH